MEFDITYPRVVSEAFNAECVIAAVFFDEDELISFGVEKDSLELDDAFYNYNQFEKTFELWSSPQYLSDFYDRHIEFFKADYWKNISELTFLEEVGKSLNIIRCTLIAAMEHNTFHELVQPLSASDEDKRLYESIRVKLKQGTITGHYPFRFYAIEIEENKCYLITGSAIKVHKDMGKELNTTIELRKMEHVLRYLNERDIDSKDTFISKGL